MILIIDIDETLIHSRKDVSPSSLLMHNDISSSDLFNVFNYTVQKRPYLDFFLSKVLSDEYYQVGIWSAGSHDYVHAIVDHIIPDKKNLKFIMTSQDCNEMRDKPLSKVRQLVREMERRDGIDHIYGTTIHDYLIIDDRDKVTGHDELNHLQIIEFEGDTIDDELLRLWNFLDKYRYFSSEYLAAHWK